MSEIKIKLYNLFNFYKVIMVDENILKIKSIKFFKSFNSKKNFYIKTLFIFYIPKLIFCLGTDFNFFLPFKNLRQIKQILS